ncbi:MAG TPA: hydrogenase maturation protease, partial [Desulfobaccales bacterium]|nr:hydrogenase maturation protease [Desulfobaccales bacterium]
MSSKTPIKIIGVGTEWRGDDAAGLLVVRGLKEELPAGVEICESPETASTLQDLWQEAERVMVVDAVVSGASPGTIHRFDAHAPGASFPVSHSPHTHGWGLSEALAMGKVFQNFPPHLIIYGIEGEKFGLGKEVS